MEFLGVSADFFLDDWSFGMIPDGWRQDILFLCFPVDLAIS